MESLDSAHAAHYKMFGFQLHDSFCSDCAESGICVQKWVAGPQRNNRWRRLQSCADASDNGLGQANPG